MKGFFVLLHPYVIIKICVLIEVWETSLYSVLSVILAILKSHKAIRKIHLFAYRWKKKECLKLGLGNLLFQKLKYAAWKLLDIGKKLHRFYIYYYLQNSIKQSNTNKVMREWDTLTLTACVTHSCSIVELVLFMLWWSFAVNQHSRGKFE